MATVSTATNGAAAPVRTSQQQRYYEADAAVARGDFQQANAILQQLVREQEDYGPAYYLMADVAMRVHQHERALALNGFADRFIRHSYDVAFQRGRILFVLSRWDEAYEAFELAYRRKPDEAMCLMLMGDARAQQGKHEEAIALFDRAMAHSDSPDILEHKGLCQVAMGENDAAADTFRALLARLPNHASAHVYLAKIDLHQGEEDRAEERVRKALMLDPKHHEGLVLLSGLMKDKGDLGSAVELSRLAIAANPYRADTVLLALRPLIATGCLDESESALKTLLQANPNDLSVMIRLITILAPRGKLAEALALTDQALAMQPQNPLLLHTRAALTGEQTATAPESYVANLFDGYAGSFDSHLQELLGYHTPRLIADAIATLAAGRTGLSLLDLGCGTGLAAEALREMTSLRVGVDLSPKMIEKSKAKGIYAEAHVDELVRFMAADVRRYDLVVAADVLVYIGDLQPLFEQAAARLADGGLFALSVERDESVERYAIRPSGRYAHSETYLRALADACGLNVLHSAPCDLRKEAGQMIVGTVMVLGK